MLLVVVALKFAEMCVLYDPSLMDVDFWKPQDESLQTRSHIRFYWKSLFVSTSNFCNLWYVQGIGCAWSFCNNIQLLVRHLVFFQADPCLRWGCPPWDNHILVSCTMNIATKVVSCEGFAYMWVYPATQKFSDLSWRVAGKWRDCDQENRRQDCHYTTGGTEIITRRKAGACVSGVSFLYSTLRR